ncbi:outer membrane protein assembly factor BamB family protein [Aureliella helgolandensis]|uniref:Outer membrane biogenesis protein BamB n=1 Tax=Aureliella helgolandensis TaxID=2527968 RepID=A0A518G7K0_9BACT|nr:PQQ-binding-like beta-propeller repeat protein [Aureliella helgolandensis]QDV24564.1 outer membrane biogenesis protein BamB [Aureliella helgolandensis]
MRLLQHHRIVNLLLLATISLRFSTVSLADNWPQWRGTGSNGISTAESIPTHWSTTENVAWRSPLPGQGGATPAVWGKYLFVTSADGDDLVLIAIDTDSGKHLWQRKVTDGNQNARAGEGNSASASPSTDGEHVWVFFSRGDNFTSAILACYDYSGNEVWKFDVADRFGKIDIQFGMTSTPVLHEEALYLQLLHGAMKRGDDTRTGKVVKLNKLTGETIWEVDRETIAVFECKHSYASPFLYSDGNQQFLIVHGADCTTGHALDDGRELWRLGGLNADNDPENKAYDLYFRFVSSPAFGQGKIVVPTCKNGPTFAINVNSELKGEVTGKESVVAWSIQETPDVSIPLIVDDLVYLLHKDGKMQCIELETGSEVYHQRTHTVQHRSSPLYADGHIYFCGKDGVCTVLKAGRDFEIVAENDMAGETITASPIVANGTLYLRTYAGLYAIRK